MSLTAQVRAESAVTSTPVKVYEYTETLDPASVGANSIAAEAFTVTGIQTTDFLVGVVPPNDTVIVGQGRITAADQVTVQFANPTAGALDPASGDWKFYVIKQNV